MKKTTDNRKTAAGAGTPAAEEKIARFLKFGSRLGLERMEALMDKLGHPERSYRVVHIAGTNGKGSAARYIYESLLEAGCKAGLYTSPYLEVFNERIEFMGRMIPGEDLERLTDAVIAKADEMVEEGMDSPTEFEVVTAVCLLYFKEAGCDAAVLEVGLGGRGDSTNIVKDPLLSVITSISYDHTDRLGTTIREIAGEKAGIIKAGRPVVISTERQDAVRVFTEKAEELGSPLYDAKRLVRVRTAEKGPEGSVFDFAAKAEENGKETILEGLRIRMAGDHQIANAAEAVLALLILRGGLPGTEKMLDIPDAAIRKGLEKAVMPARFEVLYRPDGERPGRPWVILDGAHNRDGAAKLRNAMRDWFGDTSVLLAAGMLADKDVDGILDELIEAGDDFIATEPDNPRKLSAYDLAKKIHERGRTVYEIPKPEDAAALAMSIGRGYGAVLFCGSLYLMGKIRTILRAHYLAPGNVCFEREDEEDDITPGVTEEDD